MDIQTIDQTAATLQEQAQKSSEAVQALAGKLQAASDSGNTDAREWLLDLREIALSFQAEQQQVVALLQALHTAWSTQAPAASVATPVIQKTEGLVSSLMNSGFGQALANGAGFSIGDDIVKKLF